VVAVNDDVSPADAVADLELPDAGEHAAEATADHAAAEGAEGGLEASSGMGSQSTLQEMLLSTDPSPSLERVESPFDPKNGGPSRIMRGLQKMTGVDGMPAIGDLLIGCAEIIRANNAEDAASDNGGATPDAPAPALDGEPP
jgi:hypothetical protein